MDKMIVQKDKMAILNKMGGAMSGNDDSICRSKFKTF